MLKPDDLLPKVEYIQEEVEEVAQGLACLQGYEGTALNKLTRLLRHINKLRNEIWRETDENESQ